MEYTLGMADEFSTSLTGEQFWEIKHRTDDLITQLNWTKAYAKQYIEFHYGCSSRLGMTDTQLVHLLDSLTALSLRQSTTKKSRRRLRKK